LNSLLYKGAIEGAFKRGLTPLFLFSPPLLEGEGETGGEVDK
jgi:hypothetical protein